MHLEINLSLCLPRDELSVPVARHICRHALREVGVVRDSIDDIELALTEACTNVLDHSAADDEYEVKIGINDRVCAIRVRDRGRGFDYASLQRARANLVADAESGRGIALINALVDRVKFTAKPEAGTIVHLEKELDFEEDSPVRRRVAEQAALAREGEA